MAVDQSKWEQLLAGMKRELTTALTSSTKKGGAQQPPPFEFQSQPNVPAYQRVDTPARQNLIAAMVDRSRAGGRPPQTPGA